MPHKNPPNYDKNVSPNWKPVAGLEQRKPGMAWSDRIRYWLVSLGGLAMIAIGVLLMAYLHSAKWGGIMIGAGLGVFIVLGSPSQASRNGYRDD